MSQKVISSSLTNTGFGNDRKDKNDFGAIKSVIFTGNSFTFATPVLAATRAGYLTATRAKTMFPMPKVCTFEDVSLDPVYATYDSGDQKKMRNRRKVLKFIFDVPLDSHKAMLTFNNSNLNVILVDEKRNMRFYNNGTTIQGFTTSMISVEEMTEVTPSSDKAANTVIVVEFDNILEWDESGISILPSWNPFLLKPLTNVYIEQVGAASATALTMRVYSNGGYDSAGNVVKVGIKGLVKTDFTATTTAGANQTSAFTGAITDNENGTYSAVCTGLASGTINLVAASALADTNDLFDTHFGTSDGEATLTVT